LTTQNETQALTTPSRKTGELKPLGTPSGEKPSGEPNARAKRPAVESVHFGALLIARGIITPQQLDHALEVQAKSPFLRIGEILLGLGYLSFTHLKNTLEDQYNDVKLGQLLLDMRLITMPYLEAALEVQERTGEKLGPILLALGALTEKQLYQALSLQA
jgi:hypothetical protein